MIPGSRMSALSGWNRASSLRASDLKEWKARNGMMRTDKEENESEIFRKFSETGQEKVKLSMALEGFFKESIVSGDEHRKEYGAYIRRRIRPAMECLIENEEVDRMQLLEELGWFGESELEGFLQIARARKKTASLVWLLQLKDEKYGYKDRDFCL